MIRLNFGIYIILCEGRPWVPNHDSLVTFTDARVHSLFKIGYNKGK